MRNRRLLYWLVAGLLIGAGLIGFDIYFIALPLILIGLAMLIVGILRFRSHEFWAFLIGLGGVPALIFVYDIVTASPACTGNILTVPPGGTSASCSYIPQSYYVFAIIFAVITLVGVGGLLLRRNRVHR
jgi:hypothetical protein